MTLTAAIKFTQGPNTDVPGNAVMGTLTDGAVTCTASTAGAAGPVTYAWQMIDVPPGSSVPLTVFSTASVSSFGPPDARGGYLAQLTASDGVTTITVQLVFGVLEVSGRFIPPFKASDKAMTFGGNLRGWSPTLESWFHYIDSIPIPAIVISSFAPTTALVETGATVTNPAFVAAYTNGTVLTAVLTNNFNGESKDVHATPTSFASSTSRTFATPGLAWTFTLNAQGTVGGAATPRAASIVSGQRNYAGVVAAGASLATLVAAASFNSLDTDRVFSFVITDDGTHKGQFAIPTRLGTPATVKDRGTGFGIAYTLLGSFSFTNAQGFAENYNQYEFVSTFNSTLTVDVT